MLHDALVRTLYDEICRIPLLDPHSHIDPFAPTARSLDDLLAADFGHIDACTLHIVIIGKVS